MALSPQTIRVVDYELEGISRQIWNLPPAFPKARLHALLEDLGLNIPSIKEDYCGAATRSWTQILDEEGALGATARAPFKQRGPSSDIGPFRWPFTPTGDASPNASLSKHVTWPPY
jgi:hypothetical protein